MKTGGLLSMVVVCGCWSEQLHDGVFDDAQWHTLQDQLRLSKPVIGCGTLGPAECGTYASAGQGLFFRPQLSSTGTVSCASCHDPTKWFVDSRTPNATSLGATKWTKRNSMSLVNSTAKRVYAPAGASPYSWIGQYETAGDVLELAITKAMSSNDTCFAKAITTDPTSRDIYTAAFGAPPTVSDACDPTSTAAAGAEATEIVGKTKQAFEAYMGQLVTLDTPFDHWLAGDDTAIGDSAKRGFAVFVGPGTCIECHSGPLFTDFEFHVTGVASTPGVTDLGRQDVTMDPNDAGAFMTQPLRDIATSGPYMHDGTLASLADVIAFYRRGGESGSYAGTKDPRMVPLELTDDDATDLEAFLRSLASAPIDKQYTCDPAGGCP